jgi:hypothetical protein
MGSSSNSRNLISASGPPSPTFPVSPEGRQSPVWPYFRPFWYISGANKNSNDASQFGEAMNLDLAFARAEINAAFDRWHLSQQRLRDLVNGADTYTCDSYEVSASRIKQAMRRGIIDTLSKVYRFECLRERMEGISSSEPTEEQR